MKRLDQRPFEIRNLFNPAFCGLILFRGIRGYEEADARGMPFSLTLLLLPLCLYKDSRDVIARNSRSRLLSTTELNQQLMVGFADRVTQMLPYAFEGFGLLMEKGCVAISNDARIQSVPKTVRKAVKGTDETVACQKVARILGKEFARIADRSTIYTTFGVRP
ncbi:three component ABC system middle component [Algiphilus aromaticivorans]|uniref:three component ABC system middle component n=1 Tax=Algiphilus aromaticivorans TaxID=382454 RepID=UPI0005C14D91|nr:three component ABC system middle component [Algiphilus aromaticivorans]